MAHGRRGCRRVGAAKVGKNLTEVSNVEDVPAGSNSTGTVDSPRQPPCKDEILAAVASLYDDELRPYGRILRKRLAERAGASESSARGSDDELRMACVAIDALRVESGNGGEWFALFVDRPSTFVDIYESQDVYTVSFWEAFRSYFNTASACGGGADMQLPGGRYLCAVALMDLGLPFLAGHSLGRICHIVQLAIAQKKLLGYNDGGVVPYGRSSSMVKKLCAERKLPSGRSDVLPHADWETARACVRAILQHALDKGEVQVPLSNIKRLFHSVYHMELSETALGHTRISELLKEPRFRDICNVELQARGYAVLPVFQHASDGQSTDGGDTPSVAPSCDDTPSAVTSRISWPSLLSDDIDVSSMVRCTFINAAPLPPTPLRPAASRARSVPKELRLCRSTHGSNDAEPRRPAKFCPDEPLCLEDAGEIQESLPVVTPTPYPTLLETRTHSRHVPVMPAMPHCFAPQYQPFIHNQGGVETFNPCPPPGHASASLPASSQDQLRWHWPAMTSAPVRPLPVESIAPVITGASARRALQNRGQSVLQVLAPLEFPPHALSCQELEFQLQAASWQEDPLCFPMSARLPSGEFSPLTPAAAAVLSVPLPPSRSTPRAAFYADEPLRLEEAGPAYTCLNDAPLMTPTPVTTSAFSNASCAMWS